ncbi:MAG: AAA family ATPase [Erysipelotrichaceae bacterium]|nr:AAA family ATPase [Erysipelotrichaceae bacterium]
MQATNIDYIGVLNYLDKYQVVPYSNPEAPGIDPVEKTRLLDVKKNGKWMSEELEKMANHIGAPYGLVKSDRIPWLDASNIKTRKYLWVQMKDSKHTSGPVSISIFVEKNNGFPYFRICLEIKDDKTNDDIKSKYHSHLDLPLSTNMEYVSGSNQWGNPAKLTEAKNSIIEKIKTKEYKKVQPSISIESVAGKTNDQYEAEIKEAVEKLLPYYKHVIAKLDQNTNPQVDLQNLISGNSASSVKPDVYYDKNMILYGPPGTGKTYNTAIYAVAICDELKLEDARAMDYSKVMKRYKELTEEGRVVFTTFHQSYGYEEFIEGIKPIVDPNSKDIGYVIEQGLFKNFCSSAKDPNHLANNSPTGIVPTPKKPYVFVIDEINRGNMSKIFGELITLIEETKREGMEEEASAILPYSGEKFSVPSNVYILGTMNTADRSIALMDTALRRRFQFVEMMPDADVLRAIGADKVEDLDVAAMLEKINERITYLYDREHTIGHAFFTKLAESPNIETLQSIFEKSVIPLLQEYFYEDYQKIQLVLGDNGKKDPKNKFIKDEDVKVKDIFKGSVDDVTDLPEKKYTINKEAFGDLESYKQIL